VTSPADSTPVGEYLDGARGKIAAKRQERLKAS
jgi:hypothetical protein